MGLASNDYIDVLWKLVRSMDNDEEATWGMVKMGLNMESVDINARKQEDWMKSVNTLRLALREEGKMTRAGRADSTESERKADMVSLSDSVTTLESEDQVLCPILLRQLPYPMKLMLVFRLINHTSCMS
jgi:hypothetical protein